MGPVDGAGVVAVVATGAIEFGAGEYGAYDTGASAGMGGGTGGTAIDAVGDCTGRAGT